MSDLSEALAEAKRGVAAYDATLEETKKNLAAAEEELTTLRDSKLRKLQGIVSNIFKR